MQEKTYNTRVSLTLGLQDSYGVFALLNNSTTDNIGVEIITDGILYVEDEASSIVHGGSSTWKDFDGVKDISSDVEWAPESTAYGNNFLDKFKKYFVGTAFPQSSALDIYQGENNYQYYKNQFRISFKLDQVAHGTTDTYYKYFDSKQNLRESIPSDGSPARLAIKYLKFSEVRGDTADHYIYLNADIVHFSKYYSIYKNSTMNVPALLPILYTADDLEKYNLFTSSGKMYVNTLNTWTQWTADWGGSSDDMTKWRGGKFYADSGDGHFNVDDYTDEDSIGWNAGDDSSWNMSQFKLGQYGYHHITETENGKEKYDRFFGKGFQIFSFKDEMAEWSIDPTNNNNRDNERQKVLDTWRKYFVLGLRNDNYKLELYGTGDANGDVNSNPICGLCYRGDEADNMHLLNCWYLLNASGKTKETRKVLQTVAFNPNIKKPAYIGMWIASVFCNIYHFVDNPDYTANIIHDIVYLSSHYTTYTKDITYYLKAPRNEQGVIDDSIVAFNPGGLLPQPIQFGGPTGYVALLKQLSGANDAETNGEYNSSDKNVKLFVRDCIKTIPVQYKLPYVEPDTSIIGADDSIYVLKRIAYPDKIMHGNGRSNKNSLYQVNLVGDRLQVDYLGKDFRIKYFDTLDCDYNGEKTISGTYGSQYEDDVVDMSNIWSIGEDLMLRNSKYTHPAGNYYGIVCHGDNTTRSYGDLDKREILVPFAKFV